MYQGGDFLQALEKSVELLKALADSTRFRILNILLKNESICVNEIAQFFDVSQSAISHQLKILKDNNLVKSKRDGKNIYYSLGDDHVRTIIEQVIVHVNHD